MRPLLSVLIIIDTALKYSKMEFCAKFNSTFVDSFFCELGQELLILKEKLFPIMVAQPHVHMSLLQTFKTGSRFE